jgi:ABC-type sugar transport system ATPase subunit
MSVLVETPLLSVRQICKRFSLVEVLHSVDLDFYPGQVLALLGENGAGKSTLMNIISGSLRQDAGQIVWQGSEVDLTNTSSAMRLGILHIHQELSCVGALSVMENLFLGDYQSGKWGFINRREMAAEARKLLAQVGGQHISPEASVADLSTADQQIVEIAKALSRDLRLLLMDEPTSSLTPHEVAALFRIVRELKASGVSIVFISHRLEEIFDLADRVAVLRDGSLVSTRRIKETNMPELLRDMAGRAFSFADQSPVQFSETSTALLEANQISDRNGYGPYSFRLQAGEVLGVFGLVGSGRTELLEMLCGLRKVHSGQLRFLETGAPPSDLRVAWRQGLAFLPAGRARNGIFPQLSVRENIALSFRNAKRYLWAERPAERETIDNLFNRLAIRARDKNQEILYLSGGNQQKAILARCLTVKPRVLLLDEPTHGVDVRTKGEFYRIIEELAEQGLGIVMVSSELPEVRALASTILVISRGKQILLSRNSGLTDHVLLEAAFWEQEVPPTSRAS